MKAVEQRLPRDFDKSFIVFREQGQFFPCPLHYHPEYELVLITKSTGQRMIGDHIDYFEEGDLVFIGSMLPHVCINDRVYLDGRAGHPADAVVIQFQEDFLGEKFMAIPEMEGFRKFLDLSSRGMVIRGHTRDQIERIMKRMLAMDGLQRLTSLFRIFELLSETTEFELLASPGFVQHTALNSSDHFSRVPEHILRNFHREISLPEIAGVANMAVATFCKFFKQQYRVSFVTYLNTVRVGHACKQLAATRRNVSEIAYECGFNNLTNFNRQFKKIKMLTPCDYRKMHRREEAPA